MSANMDQLIEYVTVRINKATGNVFDESTRSMVVTRLNRRMLELKIENPEDYLKLLRKNWDDEEDILIGLLTTHHTFFFREIVHFEFIQQNIDKIVANARKEGRNTIRIWSAAASKGQEAYSLAFLMDKILPNHAPDMKYEVLASDVDPQSVAYGQKGVYRYTEVKEIPSLFLSGNWEKNTKGDFARVKPHIKQNVHFQTLNLLELKEDLGSFDLIFCRNVLIYFDEYNVKKVVKGLEKFLAPTGFLVTGVSEPIGNATESLERTGPCVYSRKGSAVTPVKAEENKRPFRVVNVDDSPTVLKVLKKIFEGDDRFEIVGQCENGKELEDFLDLHNDIDIITLDLHMPVMDGVTYLEKNMKSTPNHPKVIVLSSVNRENQELGAKAIEFGAEDYIEKPNFKNFKECGDQLKIKMISLLSLAPKERQEKAQPVKVASSSITQASREKDQITKVDLKHKNVHLIFPPANKVKPLLKEIVERGAFPEVFVGASEEHLSQLKSVVEDFLSHYEFIGGSPEFKFITKLKYLQSFERQYNYPGIVFCIFRGSDLLHYLGEKIHQGSYVLSEESLHTKNITIESMPSTSWGFHVLEFLEANILEPQKLLNWNDFLDAERVLPFGHQIIVFLKNGVHKSFFLNEELRSGLSKIRNCLDEKKGEYDSFKYIGPKKGATPFINLCKLEGLKIAKLYEAVSPVKYKLSKQGVMLKRIKGVKIEKKESIRPVTLQKKEEKNKTRVLVVDDSPTMTKVIARYLENDPLVECVAIHHDIKELERSIVNDKPDVITLDMNMPEMTGDEVYEKIIKKHNIPTLLLTSNNPDCKKVIKALNLGVWDYLQKPSMKEFNESLDLIEKLKVAKESYSKLHKVEKGSYRIFGEFSQEGYVLIGSSTGGTKAIGTMLSSFPEQFPPTLICQHIPENFSRSLAELLDETNPFKVKELEDGETPQANTVYICPGGVHSEFKLKNEQLKVVLRKDVPNAKFTPSIDHFFTSFCQLNLNSPVVGVILTGMGKDGVKGLMGLKGQGAITLSQDQGTSVVYGMPRVAFESGASQKQVSIGDMANTILKNFKKNRASA